MALILASCSPMHLSQVIFAEPLTVRHQQGNAVMRSAHGDILDGSLMPAGAIDFVVPKGSGYIAHPAVTDNCMQLGPVSGLQQPIESAAEGGAAATRYQAA